MIDAVRSSGVAFCKEMKDSVNVVKAAIETNAYALKDASLGLKNTEQVVTLGAKQNALALQYAHKDLRDNK